MLAGWNRSFGGIHRLQANLRRDDENSQFGGKTTGNAGYGIRSATPGGPTPAMARPTRRRPSTTCTPLTFGYVGSEPGSRNGTEPRIPACTTNGGLHRTSATYYLEQIADLISWSGRTSPVNIGTRDPGRRDPRLSGQDGGWTSAPASTGRTRVTTPPVKTLA